MKKILRITLTIILLLALVVPSASIGQSIPEERLLPRLVDNANLLTDSQYDKLLNKLDEISERQAFDVVVITVDSIEGYTATEFADDVFDYNGFGMGEGYDGILLLISMGERDWAISTHGFGIPAFTDAGQRYMVDNFRPLLSEGDFDGAFNKFADLSDEFITKAKKGDPYDSGNMPKKPPSPLLIPISLLVGAIVSFVITGSMKAKLKTVGMQWGASSYISPGSLNLFGSRDLFLYDTVTKVARPKESSSSSSRGSSTHTSSSGRSHGGSSGKF